MGKKRNKPNVTRMRPKQTHVFVAVPSDSNTVTLAIHGFLSLLHRLNYEAGHPWRFTVQVVNGYRPVEYARNYLTRMFLESKADKLWFLDDDMLPNESTLRLLNVDADIAAGRMFMFDHSNPELQKEAGLKLCAMVASEDTPGKFRPIAPAVGSPLVHDVDVVGTGSMLIRREVIEDARMQLPTAYVDVDGAARDLGTDTKDPNWSPAVWRTIYKPNGQRLKGEDIDFCERARALGYSVKVDLGATLGHWKTVDLDEVAAIAHQAATHKSPAESAFHRFIAQEVKKCG